MSGRPESQTTRVLAPGSIGAWAIREDDPDDPVLADSVETLNKVIALRWISRWSPPAGVDVAPVRAALLEERWADAVTLWMELAGERVSVFPGGLEVHRARDYPDDEFGPRLQTTPLFRDPI